MTPEARAVRRELRDRRGIGDEFDMCDEDIQEEICEAIATAVLEAHGD